jgi:GNAT superfamily N-acetyltransferase
MNESIIVRETTETDAPAVVDLAALTWPHIARSRTEAIIELDPWRDRQAAFGAFAGGRLVSYARFHFRPVRVGAAVVNLGGVADVVTHPDFRRRGLARRVLQAGIASMKSAGLPASLLFTANPGVYRGLGWRTFHGISGVVDLSGMPRLGRGRTRITREHVLRLPPALEGVYESGCASHPISQVRPVAYWRDWPKWMLNEPNGQTVEHFASVAWRGASPCAYGLASRSAIIELCCLPGEQDAMLDVFDHLVEASRADRAVGAVRLDLPYDHAVAAALAPCATFSTATLGMVLVLDLKAMLHALQPALAERAEGIRHDRIRIHSPAGSATVTINDGEVSIGDSQEPCAATLTGTAFSSLLLGFGSVRALHDAGEVDADPRALELLDALFPCRNAHYWAIDRF